MHVFYVHRYIGTLTDKNVVILIDTSGSMTGLNFKLAKLTAKELISSLTANDFFMVLKVGSTPDGAYKPLGNCFSDLVRASGENKLAMDNIITKASSPSGVADFKDVMKFAYDKLQVRRIDILYQVVTVYRIVHHAIR